MNRFHKVMDSSGEEGYLLKTIFRSAIIIIIIFGIGFYLNISEKNENEGLKQNCDWNQETILNSTENKTVNDIVVTEGLFLFMGKKTKELEAELGRPDRIDPTPYNYDWWIYNEEKESYVQVGVKNNRVSTIFAIGENVNVSPFYIGEPIGEIYASYFIESIIELMYQGQSYQFELSEEDVNIRPIIKIGDYYVQLYIDQYKGIVSSIRFMDADTLLKLRPFDYQEQERDSSIEQLLDNEQMISGYQKQIFDLTNILRSRFNEAPLKWDETAAEEAYERGIELQQYYEMDASNTQESMELLKSSQLMYRQIGENIAIHHLDAPAIVEGWLNSKVHRDNLLNNQFTGMGIGVYKNYFIQKFTPAYDHSQYE